MPQNISLLGASYEDVPAVELPKTGGGTARFTDVSETTATATDVMEGKYFYTAAGTKTLGTARASGAIYQDEDGYLVLEEDEDVEEAEAVLFIDYDGTELHSYTRSEFDALTEMPANPVHSGLTAEGWNWTLEDAKAYIGEFPHLTIGQTYITSDGKTRFHLHVREKAKKFLFQWYQSKSYGVTIDWGDGSEETSITGTNTKTQEHEYDEPGNYVMTITSNDGTWYPLASSSSTSTMGSTVPVFKDNSMLRSARLGLGFPVNNTNNVLGWLGGNVRLETVTVPSYISSNNTGSCYLLGYCVSLKAFTIPSGWTSIPGYTFYYLNCLKYVSIPKSVTVMGDYAFNYCYKLKYIDLPPNLTNVSMYYCYNVRSLKIPRTVTGNFYVNYFYSLEHLDLPDNFSPATFSISGCDYASHTKAISIPENVTKNILLNYWYGLEHVDLPSTITSNVTFNSCYNLRSVDMPDGLSTLTGNIFNGCYNLEEVDLPSTLTSIGTSAFSNCYNLESIALPSSAKTIGTSAFNACYSLRDLEIPEGYSFVSNASSVFSGCRMLTSIELPDDLTSIGASFFQYAYSLEAIEIPSTVTSIGTSAFSTCVSLLEITVPAGVTSIGNGAFGSCVSLREIHFLSETPPTLGTNVFSNYTTRTTYGGGATIYVPYSADHSILNAYKTATNWATYADYIQEEPQ